MSEEKLYAVKNDEGKYFDCEYAEFLSLSDAHGPTIVSEDNAKDIARDYGGHVVMLVEEHKKVVITKEQAQVVKEAHDDIWPAKYITDHCGNSNSLEELLMNAYVNGYTVAKEKKYLVYKELGGKQKHNKIAQAYLSVAVPGTMLWLLNIEVKNDPRAKFTASEIEQYGLQDCEKEEVTDDEQ
ncbi:DUF1642 domain-containing protein [Lacticaseibacillus paracasei]|uniref:DUF1642 domain-containing protein n=1 Tax=Lacticaseibacillus paracasei TaxID=1597 RepID=UPI001EDF2D23|nr:DUF1642 domain-containing protein [Lacticaseibacillus paracasei]MCG4283574.1 DUF1642 domain-containing protein [Lacticaseibacillus paracasei]